MATCKQRGRSQRFERVAFVVALTLALGLCSVLVSSCGGQDLLLGGTRVQTATAPTPVATTTP